MSTLYSTRYNSTLNHNLCSSLALFIRSYFVQMLLGRSNVEQRSNCSFSHLRNVLYVYKSTKALSGIMSIKMLREKLSMWSSSHTDIRIFDGSNTDKCFFLLISFNLNCFITSLPWFSLVHNALTNNVIHTAGVLRCISAVTKYVLQKLWQSPLNKN